MNKSHRQKLDLAIKYAARINRTALMKKLESIADIKEQQDEDNESDAQNDMKNHDDSIVDDAEEVLLTPVAIRKPEVEIRPLSMSDTLRRSNPFVKNVNSPSTTGLLGLNTAQEKPQKSLTEKKSSIKPKPKNEVKKETFISWYAKQKKKLQEEFPDYTPAELTKIALSRYKEISATPAQNTDEPTEGKKRKLSQSPESENNQTKRSQKLSNFACDK